VNLRVRPGDGRVLARLRRATRLTVGCQRTGPRAAGRRGPSRIWDRVSRSNGTRGWVADGLLDTGTDGLVAPICNAPAALDGPVLPGARAGPCQIRAPVALLPPFPTARKLIVAALPGARASRARYRVPVAVTLAQSILETGGGRRTVRANNFFGLKAQSTTRPGLYAFGTRATGCVLTKTREAEGGRLVITIGAFRAYATLKDSILDHGERLTTNPVYRAAFAHTRQPRRFAQIIARHYATDPRYAAKLLDLIDRYDLDELR
jgi:flagellar protein FlgJ